jgi:hypothetical protein
MTPDLSNQFSWMLLMLAAIEEHCSASQCSHLIKSERAIPKAL